MFETLFKNAEEKPDRPTTLKEDVDWIVDHTHYPLLRAAWDEFVYIVTADSRYDEDLSEDDLEGVATDCWYALRKLQKYDYDFTRFSVFELHLPKALQDGYTVYDEILHVLIDHHDDRREVRHLLAAHPEIQKYVPAEFNNARQLLEVLAEVTRIFRWELEQFSLKHRSAIDAATTTIITNHLKETRTK